MKQYSLKIYSKVSAMAIMLCCLFAINGKAQDATMADLKQVVTRMKSLSTYSYQTENRVVFPNGQTDKNVTTVLMDGRKKRLCYKNNLQILLLTDKWAYKADHRTKQVSVFNVVKYNDRYKKALPELDAVFKSNLTATFLDSVLLRSGKLRSAKREGSLTTFKVGFPPDYYVEEMVIVYNHQRQLPESITIRSFYAGDQQRNRAKGTTYETISKNYSEAITDSDFDTGHYFKVSGAKVALAQYKNYKVSSIL